ncbi:hypothetical protein LOTGIDRAFT_173543 [Lottia gigantea]|uniref:Ig-like domain-containing protein n=1 Tax=Lottia gigantea TaxID=225164 RepID=V4AXJ6_LOTGI|nr:hypothetical protein LOTGIDRAFT_173543 [Lottia gigantea]ESO99755.1 hypothetical protein LOTGIDRAFT_173543 [Lottia gigantea]
MSMVFWLLKHKCPHHDGPEGEPHQCPFQDLEMMEGQENVVAGVRAAAATFDSGEQFQNRRKSSVKSDILEQFKIPPAAPLVSKSLVSKFLSDRNEKKKPRRRFSDASTEDELDVGYSMETSSVASETETLVTTVDYKRHREEVSSEISIDTGNESLLSDFEECELTTIPESDIECPDDEREAVVSDFDILSVDESTQQVDLEDTITESSVNILEADTQELDAEIAQIRSEIQEKVESSFNFTQLEDPPPAEEVSSEHVLSLEEVLTAVKNEIVASDGSSVSRLKDGDELEPGKKFKTAYKDGVATLSIKDLDLEDGGYYTCVAKNELGDIKTSADLKIEEVRHRRKKKEGETASKLRTRKQSLDTGDSEISPEFILPLLDQVKQVGDYIELTVTVRGRPDPEVVWYHGDIKLIPSERINIKESKSVYRLIIQDALTTDSGEYRCQATNQHGQSSSSCELKVKEKIPAGCMAPEFTQKLVNMTITEGSRARLECMVSGSPTPQIEWYKDRKRIDSDRRCRMKMEDDGFCVLSIQEAMIDDSGSFMCRAINEAGTASTEAIIRIQKMKMEPSHGEDAEDLVDAPMMKYKFQTPPDFTVQLRNKSVPEGSYVKLSCSVLGIPEPSIRWFKHGEEITKDKHYSVRNNYGLLSLEIQQASIQDIGSYTCEARNSEGTVTCNAYLDVECLDEEVTELDFARPKFLTPLQDISVVEGEEVVFECVAVGKPMPKFKWQKDMIELTDSSRITVIAERDGTAKLIIKKAKRSDAGLFYCIAYSKSGRCKCSATLRVKAAARSPPREKQKRDEHLQKVWAERIYDAPEQLTEPGKPPNFTLQLQHTVELWEGEKLKLDCSVDGLPPPMVTWHKGYRDLSYGSRHRIMMLGLMHTFEIQSVMLTDSGEYIVRATNVFGIIETSCKVVVKPRPEGMEGDVHPLVSEPEFGPTRKRAAPFFIKHLPRNIDVMEGMNVRLDCILKDGQERITWHLQDSKKEKAKLEDEGFEGDYVPMTDKPSDKPIIKLKPKDVDQPKEEDMVAPYFIRKPEDLYLTLGSEAILECEVGGNPTPTLAWSKAGKVIKNSDSLKLISKGGKHQLRIAEIIKPDEGKYSVNISSPAGADSCFARLDIEIEKPVTPKVERRAKSKKTLPTTFTKPLEEEVTAVKGDNLELVCKIEGALKIVWEKDGKQITRDVWSDENGTQTLRLNNISDKHSGLYACVATFPDKIIIKTRSWVNVTDKPQPSKTSSKSPSPSSPKTQSDDGNFKPEFQSELQDLVCRDGDTASFQCKVKGEPRPQVTWLRDGEELLDGQVYQISTIGDNCQLQITEVFPEDEGVYSCRAVNSQGETTQSCKLIVEEIIYVENRKK